MPDKKKSLIIWGGFWHLAGLSGNVGPCSGLLLSISAKLEGRLRGSGDAEIGDDVSIKPSAPPVELSKKSLFGP